MTVNINDKKTEIIRSLVLSTPLITLKPSSNRRLILFIYFIILGVALPKTIRLIRVEDILFVVCLSYNRAFVLLFEK